jgi:hypothetical protein
MGTAEQVLVIILSSLLAIFLVLSIVVAALVIKVLKHIRRITEKAEAIADKADSVTSFFQQTAGPAAIAKLVSNIVHAVRDKKGGKDE